MKLLTTLLFLLVLFTSTLTWGQANGDYRSVVSGNWDAIATWETYDLPTTSWLAATVKPGSTSNVYIQPFHLVTLTMNEACNDIHLASGTSAQGYGRVATVTFILDVNGKMRYYVYNTPIPGTSTGTMVNPPFTKSAAGSSGLVRIVGNSRNVTNTGEFGSFTATAPTTTASIEIAMNLGQTATFQVAAKFASWNITSGTLDFNGRLSVDLGAATLGNVIVSTGATLISNSTGTIMSRTGTTAGGVFTLDGTWILKGAVPNIGMTTINLNGTVQYDAAVPQTMLTALIGGVPNTYTNLILSNSGPKTLGLNTTVNGTLSLQGTASLSLSTFTLTYGGAAILEYAGSSSQTTADPELPIVNGPSNLTINNSSGVNLHASRNINGALLLTSGSLILGSSNLTLSPSATVSGTPSVSNMIVADGSGLLVKQFLDGTEASRSFTFPIGDNTGTPEYSPITLNFTSGTFASGSVSVNLKNSMTTNYLTLPLAYLNRCWYVQQGGISSFSCDVTCNYVQADVVGNENLIYCSKYDAGWSIFNIANTVTNELTGTVSFFSEFTGLDLGATPIELSSFNVNTNNRVVQLSWRTTTETNSSKFYVERKSTNMEWIKIGEVVATGNSNAPKNYSFVDKNVVHGKYQYRLKMIDADGSYEYSNTIEAEIEAPKEYSISQNYPNPFNPTTRMDYQLPFDSKVTLELCGITGEKIATLVNSELTAGNYTADVNASELNLASGIYIYRMSASNQSGQNFVQVKKLMLTK
jgi:hypothetical protein